MPEPKKKMNVVQLTLLTAVNMMGSGIIMLPANMAQVGAISLLSWCVTAVGSMAIAYSFAQAGLFNQRPGGMAAYAEDAYGRDGYFQVFFLYFLSLAIGNVAIAISAVGYLAAFVPWLASTPIATCIGVIGLIWLTTVANFGGPSVTGRIGSVTVWGVILPVGFLSLMGWFWFKSDVFREAWNPHGLSLGAGMGSSISLTLWAFLGMESAAQNSAAAENPKRDVPLACLFGTLGAAVIYILSTTVIQGIVPNADLAASTGPFGLAFARMFNPTIGSIVMALAVLACVGSLLGWQFTIAQTGKSAAEERMFPAFFTKVNRMGAPLVGMVVLGVVQSLLALSTISPTLSEQFSALVNLAVVTNVVPYVVSLSALFVIMKAAKVTQAVWRRNVAVALVAMLYSVYALFASGMEAVMGGMLVLGLTYIIWGFISPRFASASRVAAGVIVLLAFALPVRAQDTPEPTTPATTRERINQTGGVRLGYRTDARPFSYRDESGQPAGYSVELCQKVTDLMETESGATHLNVEWVPLAVADGFGPVQHGKVDLLCGGDVETLRGRELVDFSIPIFPSGTGALLRADAPTRLKEILSGRPSSRPVWRAQAGQLLNVQRFAIVGGSPVEAWLNSKVKEFQLTSKVTAVASYDAGIQQVLDHKADVFFGDRATLLNAATRQAGKLVVLDRSFTYESAALALGRGDDDFRRIVDRALSRIYVSGELRTLYTRWFGEPGENTIAFFLWNALPE